MDEQPKILSPIDHIAVYEKVCKTLARDRDWSLGSDGSVEIPDGAFKIQVGIDKKGHYYEGRWFNKIFKWQPITWNNIVNVVNGYRRI